MPYVESEKELNVQESEQEAENTAKKSEANDLQKLMKERFGDAKFGTLMNSIVDEMFKNMAEVSPTYGGTEGTMGTGANKEAKPARADKANSAEDGNEAGKGR